MTPSPILLIGALLAIGPVSFAAAHSWYPHECCNDMDCAPVESIVQIVPLGGGAPQVMVTSKHGRATARGDFPVQEFKDDRMHVCMRRHDSGDMDVVCLFMPPSM